MAAHSNEDKIVKFLIENGADVNIKFENGDTLLMWAASHGKIEIVRNLISNGGVNIDINDENGYTALFRAITTG